MLNFSSDRMALSIINRRCVGAYQRDIGRNNRAGLPCCGPEIDAKEKGDMKTWRKATVADIGKGLEVRWLSETGWLYPVGIQADNLLTFDTGRCEVAV